MAYASFPLDLAQELRALFLGGGSRKVMLGSVWRWQLNFVYKGVARVVRITSPFRHNITLASHGRSTALSQNNAYKY